jgi:hypothetical protein
MAIEKHSLTVGDTLTPLGCQLKQVNASGVLTPVSLAGATVKFKMSDTDGVIVVTETETGVTVVDATTGKVSYDFQAADVDTAGIYYGRFVVYSGLEKDTYPIGNKLVIEIVAAA